MKLANKLRYTSSKEAYWCKFDRDSDSKIGHFTYAPPLFDYGMSRKNVEEMRNMLNEVLEDWRD